ncbi:hypothetical protein I302_103474 [Kwoniella bestiolae CBS 10118]|uniref:Uncharacterized protein n=1 Tax=Kwoniella bestiolae CBS 10118 TaxID=1296100 RepID=A0A1B9G8G8_9TREE|nr:hypothetical protein I302_02175 [Kwoniella bestiolae CBS 10118]OCF27334.1 hypothetical protein I302_02175 [Kwoniella bestiolae CBS 10118]
MSTSTSSFLPLLAVGVIWYYLSSRGSTTRVIWLMLNVLDTFRAFRLIRPNGRRIGVNTRKKAMKESLICWVIYVIAQTAGPVLSTMLSWIPFYSPVKAAICIAFLCMRLSVSSHIFHHILTPAIRPYEPPIDLTVLLIQSIGVLLFHYTLQVPVSLIFTTLRISGTSLKSTIHGITNLVKSHSSPNPSTPPRIVEQIQQDRPTVDEDHIRASFLSPPPNIPGSILLRHPSPRPLTPRRSISFLDPPATPRILSPSPPSSPEIEEIAGPSTPRRSVAANGSRLLLGVEEVREIRRSPRGNRVQNNAVADDDSLMNGVDLINSHGSNQRLKPAGPRARIGQSDRLFNPENIMASSKKGKGRAVPVLIIPDEDDDEDEGQNEVIPNAKPETSKPRPRSVPPLNGLPSTREIIKPEPSTTRFKPVNLYPILPTTSTQIKSIPQVRDTSRLRPTQDRSQLPDPTINPTRKTSRTVSTSSSSATINPKPKTPRKVRILKASEGGVAHDKPLSTAASRAKARTTSRAKTKTNKADAEVDEGKNVGEKRNVRSENTSRKKIRKE